MAAKQKPAKKTLKKDTRFKPGNQFWKARSSHGRKPIFPTPEDLWNACLEYFQWIDDNPLQAAELVKYQGEAKLKYVPKMRAMTIDGLTIFLDIDSTTWFDYAKNKSPEFSLVCTRVEKVIRDQKFGGAAAEMLNPSIIARDLGLADKRSTIFPDKDGNPQDINGLEAATRLAHIINQAAKRKLEDKKGGD